MTEPRDQAQADVMPDDPQSDSSQAPLRHGKWRKLIQGMIVVVLAPTGLATLAAFLAPLGDAFELLVHFRLQYTVLLMGAGLFGWWIRWRGAVRAAVVLGAANALFIVPAYLPRPTPQVPRQLRVVTLNVWAHNNQHERVLQFLRSVDADLVVMQEVTPQWIAALMPLHDEYPYMHTRTPHAIHGVVVYSRYPLSEVKSATGVFASRSVLLQLEVDGQPLRLLGVHAFNPQWGSMSPWRNRQLAEWGKLAAAQTEPLLMIGDFNVTPFSPFYRQLLRTSGLVDSRRGFGLQPTWPAWCWPLRIPIDQCLVSPSLQVLDRRLGPHVGSDHLPVIIDLGWNSQAQSETADPLPAAADRDSSVLRQSLSRENSGA